MRHVATHNTGGGLLQLCAFGEWGERVRASMHGERRWGWRVGAWGGLQCMVKGAGVGAPTEHIRSDSVTPSMVAAAVLAARQDERLIGPLAIFV